MNSVYKTCCLRQAQNTMKYSSHPGHLLFNLPPSGKRYRCITVQTSRKKNSFFPWALRILNTAVVTSLSTIIPSPNLKQLMQSPSNRRCIMHIHTHIHVHIQCTRYKPSIQRVIYGSLWTLIKYVQDSYQWCTLLLLFLLYS